ncbi:MAG: hypothetical protein FP826_14630 [Sphingomonadales bacterium]|nr:hypothetical protein [Sphingomonadales bacterium]MBU3991166.1 hypothetical protein [Alphaproteobacteria bacterium]
MRATSAGAVLLALAGCSSDKAPDVAAGSEHIACALGQAAPFAPVCAVDRVEQGGRKALVVRHPDGGFRRFAVLTDGHGLAAADGAALAQVVLAGGLLEVRVDDDRYRFPFTVKAHAAD